MKPTANHQKWKAGIQTIVDIHSSVYNHFSIFPHWMSITSPPFRLWHSRHLPSQHKEVLRGQRKLRQPSSPPKSNDGNITEIHRKPCGFSCHPQFFGAPVTFPVIQCWDGTSQLQSCTLHHDHFDHPGSPNIWLYPK